MIIITVHQQLYLCDAVCMFLQLILQPNILIIIMKIIISTLDVMMKI